MEVHHSMLTAACRPRGELGPVDFFSCTTARISPMYLAAMERGKMVDFCLIMDPAKLPSDPAGTEEARERMANLLSPQHMGYSINHTDYTPFALRPIILSIETKRAAVEWDKSVLQMGTWQATQLRALSTLAKAVARLDSPEGISSDEEEATMERLPIDFVPGLIIQGHDWIFVATTVDDQGTITFRSKIFIGSTDTVLGIYTILAVLKHLVRWSHITYWPLFKKILLRK